MSPCKLDLLHPLMFPPVHSMLQSSKLGRNPSEEEEKVGRNEWLQMNLFK